MLKRKKVLWIALAFVLAFTVLNPSVFAQGKEGLAHIVQEHTLKIAQLEESLKKLNGSRNTEVLSEEVKQALRKEAGVKINSYNEMNGPDGRGINVSDYQIVEIDGEIILKVSVEGSYDWTETESGEGIGRNFARALVFNFDGIAKMYGVNLKYEFYENGERIKIFTEIN